MPQVKSRCQQDYWETFWIYLWSSVWSGLNSFRCMSSMTLLFLLFSPPANTLSYDVTMHAVHFLGQVRSYLPDQRVSYLWLKERGREREICASVLGWNMDTQGIFPSPFPSFLVTGRTLSDLVGSFSLVSKNELHPSWCHKTVY